MLKKTRNKFAPLKMSLLNRCTVLLSVQLKVKLATRTKTNINLLKKAVQMSEKKRQLTYFFFFGGRGGAYSDLISRCQHREGKSECKSALTKTNFPPSHKQRTHCQETFKWGVQRGAAQQTVPNKCMYAWRGVFKPFSIVRLLVP